MAGIYIHIPFCRQACHYCDFHFSVNTNAKELFLASLITEIELQKNYLEGETVSTVYFGGGTPSLLHSDELKRIFEKLYSVFEIHPDSEITLEANPDDVTTSWIQALRLTPVNRLSIGIQSLSNHELKWMNRIHTASQAEASVKRAQDAGFENISVDLIYGSPLSNTTQWAQHLSTTLRWQVKHLSCYALTVEPRTALWKHISTGKSKPVNENEAAAQYEHLLQQMHVSGWLHYEISNFAFNEQSVSRHNSAYWNRKKYLGLGPSAHSFNGHSRKWNVASNQRYIQSISKHEIPSESETLSEVQIMNEKIMTGLRLHTGLKLDEWPADIQQRLLEKSSRHIHNQHMVVQNHCLSLTDQGKLLADAITLDFMWDE